MFELRISPKAERRIKELKKEHKIEILNLLKEIKEDPLLGKPLSRDLNGKFTYRLKAYRIIYKVNLKDKVVDILAADHRGKVYN